MKISAFVSCSALLLASVASAAAPHDPNRIDTCRTPGVVAYTFDDGPGMYNDQLLATLAKKNVTATFFVLGSMIDENAQQAGALKKILDHGHQLASHTYSHGNLDGMTPAKMQEEMSTTSDTMFKHSGIRPRYMRAPEGRCDTEACKKVMKDLGLVVTHWNVDTNDWRFTALSPAEATKKGREEVNRVIIQGSDPKTDSFILLQHEIHKFSVDFLVDEVVDAILNKGYKFVSIEECIGEKAYLEGSILHTTSAATPTTTAGVATATSSGAGAHVTTSTASKETNNQNAAGVNQIAAWALGLSAVLGLAMI